MKFRRERQKIPGNNIANNRFMLLGGVILVVFMLIQLVVLSMYGTQGDQLSQIVNKQKEYELQNQQLSAEINNLQSINRIEQIAVDKYGLVKASEIKSLDINEKLSDAR